MIDKEIGNLTDTDNTVKPEFLSVKEGFGRISNAEYIGNITSPGDTIETHVYKDKKKNQLLFHYKEDIEPVLKFNSALTKKLVADEIWEGGDCFKLAYRMPLSCYKLLESFGYLEPGNEKELGRLLKENAHLFKCTNRNV